MYNNSYCNVFKVMSMYSVTENDDKYKEIIHQFDVWHLCKNFIKNLVQVNGMSCETYESFH